MRQIPRKLPYLKRCSGNDNAAQFASTLETCGWFDVMCIARSILDRKNMMHKICELERITGAHSRSSAAELFVNADWHNLDPTFQACVLKSLEILNNV